MNPKEEASRLGVLVAENAELRKRAETAEAYHRIISDLPNCNDCMDARICAYRAPWGRLVRFNCPIWRGPMRSNSSTQTSNPNAPRMIDADAEIARLDAEINDPRNADSLTELNAAKIVLLKASIYRAVNIPPEASARWIPNSPFTGNCSSCGADGNLKQRYCGDCGARMNKEEAEGGDIQCAGK